MSIHGSQRFASGHDPLPPQIPGMSTVLLSIYLTPTLTGRSIKVSNKRRHKHLKRWIWAAKSRREETEPCITSFSSDKSALYSGEKDAVQVGLAIYKKKDELILNIAVLDVAHYYEQECISKTTKTRFIPHHTITYYLPCAFVRYEDIQLKIDS